MEGSLATNEGDADSLIKTDKVLTPIEIELHENDWLSFGLNIFI